MYVRLPEASVNVFKIIHVATFDINIKLEYAGFVVHASLILLLWLCCFSKFDIFSWKGFNFRDHACQTRVSGK